MASKRKRPSKTLKPAKPRKPSKAVREAYEWMKRNPVPSKEMLPTLTLGDELRRLFDETHDPENRPNPRTNADLNRLIVAIDEAVSDLNREAKDDRVEASKAAIDRIAGKLVLP